MRRRDRPDPTEQTERLLAIGATIAGILTLALVTAGTLIARR